MMHPGQTDPLRELPCVFVRNPEDIKRSAINALAEMYDQRGEPLAMAWNASSWPLAMLMVLEWSLRDVAAARQVVIAAIDRLPEQAEYLELRRLLLDGKIYDDLSRPFWRMSREQLTELAGSIRQLAPAVRTLHELEDEFPRLDAERRARLRRVGFPEVFERQIGRALPFAIPEAAIITQETEDGDDELVTTMVATLPASNQPLLVQAHLSAFEFAPVGYFFTGFWGHGVNSYAFYYCDVSESRRVYLRIQFGGAYGDIARERADVIEALEGLQRFEELAAHHLTRWTLCMSIGGGVFSAERRDGTAIRRELRTLAWHDLEQEVRGRTM